MAFEKTFVLLAIFALPGHASAAPREVHLDFEIGDLQGWSVVTADFTQVLCKYGRPLSASLPQKGQSSGYLSTSGLAAGKTGTDPDRMGGIIESPVFVIEDDKASILLGGVAAQVRLAANNCGSS